jgi:hypothetical protein
MKINNATVAGFEVLMAVNIQVQVERFSGYPIPSHPILSYPTTTLHGITNQENHNLNAAVVLKMTTHFEHNS